MSELFIDVREGPTDDEIEDALGVAGREACTGLAVLASLEGRLPPGRPEAPSPWHLSVA